MLSTDWEDLHTGVGGGGGGGGGDMKHDTAAPHSLRVGMMTNTPPRCRTGGQAVGKRWARIDPSGAKRLLFQAKSLCFITL